jgi:hypothetical protein
MTVSCQAIIKQGYSKAIYPGTFAFGAWGPAAYQYRPDPGHPTAFLMWNDAFRRIVSKRITTSVEDSKTYACHYLPAVVESNVSGLDDLAFTVKYPKVRPQGAFEWGLLVQVTDVTEAQCHGALEGRAPAEGYVPKLEYVMKADDPQWSSSIAKRFYTKDRHGQIYAAVELTINLDPKGGPATATIEYTASFDHSPDLTPGPVSQFKNDGVAGRH